LLLKYVPHNKLNTEVLTWNSNISYIHLIDKLNFIEENIHNELSDETFYLVCGFLYSNAVFINLFSKNKWVDEFPLIDNLFRKFF